MGRGGTHTDGDEKIKIKERCEEKKREERERDREI